MKSDMRIIALTTNGSTNEWTEFEGIKHKNGLGVTLVLDWGKENGEEVPKNFITLEAANLQKMSDGSYTLQAGPIDLSGIDRS